MSKLFVEPVIGYRTWRLHPTTYAIQSQVCTQDWEDDGPTQASCRPRFVAAGTSTNHLKGEHPSPTKGCWCGLHGWHRPQDVRGYLDDGEFALYGAALAWGKYRVATKGFKIQFMQPLALVDPRPDREVLGWRALRDKVCERYQVPLIPKDLLKKYAETFGKPMGVEFTG